MENIMIVATRERASGNTRQLKRIKPDYNRSGNHFTQLNSSPYPAKSRVRCLEDGIWVYPSLFSSLPMARHLWSLQPASVDSLCLRGGLEHQEASEKYFTISTWPACGSQSQGTQLLEQYHDASIIPQRNRNMVVVGGQTRRVPLGF